MIDLSRYVDRSRLALVAGLIASASPLGAAPYDKPPFDPSKGLKDYAGTTLIGSKSSATGRSDSVIAGEYAEECAGLQLKNCTGMQVQVYPSFHGSWPEAAPETLEKMTFNTEGLSALVNWSLEQRQKTLHHLMTANDYQRKMEGWNTVLFMPQPCQISKQRKTGNAHRPNLP